MSSLPTEIVVHIFTFLPLSDLLDSCCLVCRRWHEAANTPSLHVRTVVTFQSHDDFARGFSTFALSNAVYSRMSLKTLAVSSGGAEGSWKLVLPRLSSVSFERCEVSEKELVAMLSECVGLKELKLVDMNEVMISGLLLANPEEIQMLRSSLDGVSHLDLSRNQHLTDSIFNRLTECMPNLSALTMDSTKIMNHKGIYRKFYPDSQAQTSGSPSVLTFRNLLQFVAGRAARLRYLSLRDTSVDGVAVQDLASVQGLNLVELDIGRNSMISQEAVLCVARSQKSLRRLNLDLCRRVFMDYPATTINIFQELENVKDLSLRCLTVPAAAFETCLAMTDGLESLDCTEMDVPGRSLADGLTGSKGTCLSLRKLKLVSFGMAPDDLGRLLCNLGSLVELDISNCQEGVTDSVMQIICCNLRLLKVLRVKDCRRLTDVGFTGVVPNQEEEQVPTEANDVAAATKEKMIFLGSKAEAEVLEEARRLREESGRKIDSSKGSLVSVIRALSVLEASATRISDLSLCLAFNFAELRFVNLSLCVDITDRGFEQLGVSNPGLETVILKQCGVGDAGLNGLTRWTPRLKVLDVEACRNLTSSSMAELPRNCPRLKHLDVSFCNKVKVSVVEMLKRSLPMLRKVGMRGLHIAECLEDYET